MVERAVRVSGQARGDHAPEPICRRALELGLRGWVRAREDGSLELHAEGPEAQVVALVETLSSAQTRQARIEGHEQFAIRGAVAGAFVVQEHAATAHHYDLRLEVDGVMRSWAVPKGPSLDPGVKRLAVQVEDHSLEHNDFEGRYDSGGAVIVWDRGGYEQGGLVPWPEALERGHAVFVLHGEKLRGGFALQRTRGGPPRASAGPKFQWLLVKRRDDEARPGSDIVAQEPHSVLSGRTLAGLLA